MDEPRPQASAVLYAVGPAGSGASVWRDFARAVPSRFELNALRLPGREKRFGEAPPRTVGGQISDLADRLITKIEADRRPYYLVGACAGALTTYELARSIESKPAVAGPLAVVPVERAALVLATPAVPEYTLPSEDLQQALIEAGGQPEFLRDPRFFAAFERTIRADLEAAETYSPAAEPLLRTGIVVLDPEDQDGSDRPPDGDWAARTAGAIRRVTVPAGPNLLLEHSTTLAAVWDRIDNA